MCLSNVVLRSLTSQPDVCRPLTHSVVIVGPIKLILQFYKSNKFVTGRHWHWLKYNANGKARFVRFVVCSAHVLCIRQQNIHPLNSSNAWEGRRWGGALWKSLTSNTTRHSITIIIAVVQVTINIIWWKEKRLRRDVRKQNANQSRQKESVLVSGVWLEFLFNVHAWYNC